MDTKAIFFKDFANSYIPHIFKELYIDKIFDKYFIGKRDLTVIDGGANLGLFTHYVEPFSSKIYAIEPSSDSMSLLKQMVEFNKLTGKVIPIQKALWIEDTQKTFYYNANTTMNSLSNAVSDGTKEEKVDCIRLDTLFSEHKIDHLDVLKIDIEGAECEVLGSDSFDNVADKIDLIIGEYHQWSNYNPNLLISSLRDRGFKASFPGRTEAAIFIAERI